MSEYDDLWDYADVKAVGLLAELFCAKGNTATVDVYTAMHWVSFDRLDAATHSALAAAIRYGAEMAEREMTENREALRDWKKGLAER